MRYYKIFSFLLAVLFANTVFAQTTNRDVLDSFSGKFITAIRTHEKPRAYLVTDKAVFTAGSKIWFSAFLLNSVSQKIYTKSRFLFVDLVNENDSVIKAVVLDAANRQIESRIVLPQTIATGYYWLRAYTKQMVEGDTSSICVKPLYIFGNTDDNNAAVQKKNTNLKDSTPLITFYPEGGSVITGINSAIALQTNFANGDPVVIDGFIKDNRDTTIAKFTTNVNGFVKIDFEPSGFRKYKAVINWHGKEVSYPLPDFDYHKGQISVTTQPGNYKLRVLLGDSIYTKEAVTYLVGVSKDSLFYAVIGRGQYEAVVARQAVPDGIATFYLFDKGFNLLSERSIYVRENNVQVKLAADKKDYTRRDKVTLDLSVEDAQMHPIPALMALSVSDANFSDANERCGFSVNKQFLQQTDNMFLAHNDCLTDDDIDLLMIAKNNTYQKFSETVPPYITGNVDSLFYIKGVALNGKKAAAANKILMLLSNSGDLALNTDTTDNEGRFCFPVDRYEDSTEFVIQSRNVKGNTEGLEILLDPFVYPKLSTPASLKQFLPVVPQMVKRYLNIYNNVGLMDDGKQTLPPVTVKYSKKNISYDESKRVSPNSAIISSDDLNERNSSVGNAVLRVGGMHLLNGFLVVNGLTAMKAPDAGSEPMLLINGSQVGNAGGVFDVSPVMNNLNSLNAKDIDFIEILKGPEAANYGVRGGNGVILVNLLTVRRPLAANDADMKIFYTKGLSNPTLFPSIDYQAKDAKTKMLPDIRSTLFWNGSFLTDASRQATITLYTGDVPSTYKATITGITVHGDIVYKTISFKTK